MRTLRIALGFLLAFAACKPQPDRLAPAPTVHNADAPAAPDMNVPEADELDEGDVRAALDLWLDAQNDGDFTAYESLYGEPFRGVKRIGEQTTEFDRAGWLADRQRMFQKPMKVGATSLNIRMKADGATVRFVQSWASGEYHDTGPKELVLAETAEGLRISSEVMLRSTIGTSGKPLKRPANTTLDELLASNTFVAVASDNVLFDPRMGGGCGDDWDDCRDTWPTLDSPEDGFTRKVITREQAAEFVGLLSDSGSYGASPAACSLPRLWLAAYHENESIPWATVGVCIECATVEMWPRVGEIHGAMPPEMSGLTAAAEFRSWCTNLGLVECTDDRSYWDRD